MIKGAKRPLVIKRNKGALDLDRLFSQVNRRTANIQSEEDLIREEAPGGLFFYHNKLSYILDGRGCIQAKQSPPMPYNTWVVTRENPTAVCVKFTDR